MCDLCNCVLEFDCGVVEFDCMGFVEFDCMRFVEFDCYV